MSQFYIRDQIRKRGKASVVIMLGEDSAERYVADLTGCFEHSEHHKAASSAHGRKSPALYLAKLGVMCKGRCPWRTASADRHPCDRFAVWVRMPMPSQLRN